MSAPMSERGERDVLEAWADIWNAYTTPGDITPDSGELVRWRCVPCGAPPPWSRWAGFAWTLGKSPARKLAKAWSSTARMPSSLRPRIRRCRSRALRTERDALADLVGQLADITEGIAGELEAEVRERYRYGDHDYHPAMRYRFERDMAHVITARSFVARARALTTKGEA